MASPDLKNDSLWRPVRLIVEAVNNAIVELYEQRGVQGVPPRYSMVLIRLSALGSLTIRGLAEEVEVTHSAMSQTVAAMRRDGLVETVPGADARTREVALTDRGRELVPFLEAEWWATEAALAELESEVECTFSEAAVQIQAALDRRPFTSRLAAHLGEPDGMGRGGSGTGALRAPDDGGPADRDAVPRGAPDDGGRGGSSTTLPGESDHGGPGGSGSVLPGAPDDERPAERDAARPSESDA